MNNNKALLIIDMQKGSFTPKTPRFNTKNVVDRINSLSERFRNSGYPVIFVQHDGTGSGEFEKNDEDWMILDDLNVDDNDIKIDKYANDIFYKSNLESKLQKLNISHLFITGCATDFCVESTVQSAIAKDYNLTIVADGHTTADRIIGKAKSVIEHYNWVWENMIPTGGLVEVLKAEKIIENLSLKAVKN